LLYLWEDILFTCFDIYSLVIDDQISGLLEMLGSGGPYGSIRWAYSRIKSEYIFKDGELYCFVDPFPFPFGIHILASTVGSRVYDILGEANYGRVVILRGIIYPGSNLL